MSPFNDSMQESVPLANIQITAHTDGTESCREQNKQFYLIIVGCNLNIYAKFLFLAIFFLEII